MGTFKENFDEPLPSNHDENKDENTNELENHRIQADSNSSCTNSDVVVLNSIDSNKSNNNSDIGENDISEIDDVNKPESFILTSLTKLQHKTSNQNNDSKPVDLLFQFVKQKTNDLKKTQKPCKINQTNKSNQNPHKIDLLRQFLTNGSKA